ncbi:MAG: glyoxalase [Leeuwenhoekiella sp.]
MQTSKIKSIRPFIGAKDFDISRQFYDDFGFDELPLGENMSYFHQESFGVYLQRAYVKDWVDNSMLFLEVENVEDYLKYIQSKNLCEKYEGVRVSQIVYNDWGSEFFVHDPSGILWHIGSFKD